MPVASDAASTDFQLGSQTRSFRPRMRLCTGGSKSWGPPMRGVDGRCANLPTPKLVHTHQIGLRALNNDNEVDLHACQDCPLVTLMNVNCIRDELRMRLRNKDHYCGDGSRLIFVSKPRCAFRRLFRLTCPAHIRCDVVTLRFGT